MTLVKKTILPRCYFTSEVIWESFLWRVGMKNEYNFSVASSLITIWDVGECFVAEFGGGNNPSAVLFYD